jgi:periplasmic protein TonB
MTKRLLLTALAFVAITTTAHAQKTEASFPGGDTAWMHFLNHTMRYPDDAVNNEIMGTVIVSFTVNTDSTIADIQAISGPKKGGLREESVRVITLSRKWIPATDNGVPVKSTKQMPLKFRLEKG